MEVNYGRFVLIRVWVNFRIWLILLFRFLVVFFIMFFLRDMVFKRFFNDCFFIVSFFIFCLLRFSVCRSRFILFDFRFVLVYS